MTKEICSVSLQNLSPKIELDKEGNVTVAGSVSWKDLKEFCDGHSREVMTSPTEELALVLSGIATSATGERCFGFGTLREQLVDVTYMNNKGEQVKLISKNELKNHTLFKDQLDLLESYQDSYRDFSHFKNAPFPRLEFETDLMTGTEGQLGIVVEATIKTVPKENIQYIFISLPKWEKDYKPHLEIFFGVQNLRHSILSCELIDENSTQFLPKEDQIRPESDLIFLEVRASDFENVYEELLSKLKLTSEESIFEVPAPRVREFRMNIPRYIFEENQKMGVIKKGTDVQVRGVQFAELLDYYRGWVDSGLKYNMFGHFGDAHLHFNFMPTKDQVVVAERKLEALYHKVAELEGSPFAEHGIGIIKKKFISGFYNATHRQMFKHLKTKLDPHNIFFPDGFMSKDIE